MSDVAAYYVLVCALFPVQGGVWTGSASPHTSAKPIPREQLRISRWTLLPS